MLAAAPFESPLFWAILIGWILSVTVHEFAHGLVAHFGGDYTIRERGGVPLNPLQYFDPLMSIILPAVFLLMGGVPLPGGVTYVRNDLLKNRAWESAVSMAGPVSNLLMCGLCLIPLHPAFGWLDPSVPVSEADNPKIFLAAMAMLQFVAVCLNSIPVPPLDGFNTLAPYLDPATRQRVRTPPVPLISLILLFVMLGQFNFVQWCYDLLAKVIEPLGFTSEHVSFLGEAFNHAVLGR